MRHSFDPWVSKVWWKRKWQFTLVFLPGKSHGQRSLENYSPQGHKQSDTAERLSTHTHTHTHTHISKFYEKQILHTLYCQVKLILSRQELFYGFPEQLDYFYNSQSLRCPFFKFFWKVTCLKTTHHRVYVLAFLHAFIFWGGREARRSQDGDVLDYQMITISHFRRNIAVFVGWT